MDWVGGVLQLVWTWLDVPLRVLGAIVIVIIVWRFFFAWTEAIVHNGELLVEIRDSLIEIRAELKRLAKNPHNERHTE